MTQLLPQLATALGLGVGAGVNAYATLLVFGLIARLKPGMLPGDLPAVLASTPVLIVVGVLYLIEFFADKIPAVDHAWDAVHTFVRPVAGALLAVAASHEIPKEWVVIAAVISGGAALGSHAAKAGTRVGSSTFTAGVASPVLSVVEDLFAFGNAAIAIFLPFVAAAVALLFLGGALLLLVFWVRWRRPVVRS